MPNATGLTTFASKSPSLNHSRFGTARTAGFQMAIVAKTTATPRAHHRGVSPCNNGQPAISRNAPANTKPNERSVDPSTCCSRDKSWCAMAHEDLSREQQVEGSTDRSFGLGFAGGVLLISGWPLLSGETPGGWGLG